MSEWQRKPMDICSAVVESEHIIEAEEASCTSREKVEDLSKLDWILALINKKIT